MPSDSGFLARYGPWGVVTGACSGIGREMARLLAAWGMHLALTARSAAALEALAADLRAQHGIETAVIAADLATDGVKRVLDAVQPLDAGLLVNSAGFGLGGPFLAAPLESQLEMADVNCRALLELTHGIGERLARRGRGGVVLLSSLVAFQGTPYSAAYAATKAFVQSLGEALAAEWAPRGVDVLTAAPGPTVTGFGARAGMDLDDGDSAERVAADILSALGRRRTVVPGSRARRIGAVMSLTPRFLRIRIMERVMRSMTERARE